MNKYTYIVFVLLYSIVCSGQVSINEDGSAADSVAVLDLKSTTKGFLLPRMTSEERNSIFNPPEGLMIFNIESHKINYFYNGWWREITGNPVGVGMIYNTVTGRIWMDRNLGAGSVASSITSGGFGDLYQWGKNERWS